MLDNWHRLHPVPDIINMSAIDTCAANKGTVEPKLTLTPDNRGVSYGDGFFSTMGVINGEILWQSYHAQRLNSHAQALQLNIDNQKLLAMLASHAKQLEQGVMKVVITRAQQAVRGYGFTANKLGSDCEIWLKSTAMSIETTACTSLSHGCSVLLQPSISAICLSAKLACLPPPLAGLKSLNRLDSVLASGELQRVKGANPNIGEGLVRDMTGCWVEGTMSNVFYQLSSAQSTEASYKANHHLSDHYLLSGQWFTPPIVESGVAGVMRQVIIDNLINTDKPVIERALLDKDLAHISKLFFCNALRGVMPVSSLTLLNGELLEFG
ncbi:aminotransferase class IV [Psychrobacter jeotgali]|uniref:aminotransferase class IV n=1 Tax=Psychrobacter jeotgali TaxID=179010 RepID=UPI001D0F71AC|nr:aminotransferase class IV [Psychrobacter jeotgali]